MAVFRFWQIFADLGVRTSLVTEVAYDLHVVSIIFGEYNNAVVVCDHEESRLSDSDEFLDKLDGARHLAFKAVAISCMRSITEADPLFDEANSILYELKKRLDTVPRRKREESRVALDLCRRTICREQLRSEIRCAWQGLAVSDWPSVSAPRVREESTKSLIGDFIERAFIGAFACGQRAIFFLKLIVIRDGSGRGAHHFLVGFVGQRIVGRQRELS